jgi:uncharacterized membrane protein
LADTKAGGRGYTVRIALYFACFAWVINAPFPPLAVAGYAAFEIPEGVAGSQALEVDDLDRVLVSSPDFCGFGTTVVLPPLESGLDLVLQCAACSGFPHVGVRARGLGRDGTVLGELLPFGSGFCPGVGSAAAWDEHGTPLPLTSGGTLSFALDANRQSQVVGGGIDFGDGGSIDVFAVTWPSTSAAPVRLPQDDGETAGALRVNDAGLIIGNEAPLASLTSTRAVIWTPGPDGYSFHRLGELAGGSNSYASGLDEEGRVVGHSTDARGNDVAVLWRAGPSGYAVEVLPAPFSSGWCSRASAISERGEIAGRCESPEQPNVGVLWKIDGDLVHFEQIFDPLPGFATSDVLALNDSGLAVGSSGESYQSRATFWRIGVLSATSPCRPRLRLHRGTRSSAPGPLDDTRGCPRVGHVVGR